MPRNDCTPIRPRSCRRVHSHDDDLPRARCSRFRVSAAMRPTDFCHPLPVYSVPALLVSDPLGPPPKEWCDRRIRRFTTRWTRFGGSCGDEEGYSPSRRGFRCLTAQNHSAARSTHDFASDASSPFETRLRLHRSACVGLEGSRPLPPHLVKGAACDGPRRLPSERHPISLEAAPRSDLSMPVGLSTSC
jgi:hypothetical protein